MYKRLICHRLINLELSFLEFPAVANLEKFSGENVTVFKLNGREVLVDRLKTGLLKGF